MLPIKSNSGGEASHAEDCNGDVNIYYNQCIGLSPLYNAFPMIGRESFGAATAAIFQAISSPAADKLSLKYFTDKTTTSPTAVPDNTARFDYLTQVAAARSATQRGIFGHSDNFMQYVTIKGDESSWDRRLASFIAALIQSPKLPVVSLARLLPAMTKDLSRPGLKIATASQSKYGGG
jgi:hypothetical protein